MPSPTQRQNPHQPARRDREEAPHPSANRTMEQKKPHDPLSLDLRPALRSDQPGPRGRVYQRQVAQSAPDRAIQRLGPATAPWCNPTVAYEFFLAPLGDIVSLHHPSAPLPIAVEWERLMCAGSYVSQPKIRLPNGLSWLNVLHPVRLYHSNRIRGAALSRRRSLNRLLVRMATARNYCDEPSRISTGCWCASDRANSSTSSAIAINRIRSGGSPRLTATVRISSCKVSNSGWNGSSDGATTTP